MEHAQESGSGSSLKREAIQYRLSRRYPIVITKEGPHAWTMTVLGNPLVNVTPDGPKPTLTFKGRDNHVEGAPSFVFRTRGDADGIAHVIGRYMLDLGDFTYEYVEHRDARLPTQGASGEGPSEVREQPAATVARDFDTIEAAVAHAKTEGATHVRVIGKGRSTETIVYWPVGSGDRQFHERAIYKSRGRYHLPKDATLVDIEPWQMRALDGGRQPRRPKPSAAETVIVAAEAARSLQPGYYAVSPGGRIAAGPFKSIDEAKSAARPINGYVQFEAGEQPAAGEGPYLIPYIHMERDAEAYEEVLAQANRIGPIATAADVYRALNAKMAKEDQEVFGVLLVDVRGQCLGWDEVARGARDRVEVSIARVFSSITTYRPHHFVVVHNHPSGKATPSKADRELTKRITEAAAPFSADSAFVDHVVIGTGEYFSFADDKLHKARG